MASRRRQNQGQGVFSFEEERYGGATPNSIGVSPDLDPASLRRRVHDASATFPEDQDDWEHHAFDSSRVSSASYSPSRRQLVVEWTNAPGGIPYPPYTYDAVPPAVWTGFWSSGSAGRYVNSTLNTYPYRPTPTV